MFQQTHTALAILPHAQYAIGGSTNAVLHLMALAREAGLTQEEFDITSFNHYNDTVPILINCEAAIRRLTSPRISALCSTVHVILDNPDYSMYLLLLCSVTARSIPHGRS